MITGPNIEREGLVFGYDTGYGIADNSTATRFYKGKPVVNMLSYGDDFNSWTKAKNSGSYPTINTKVKEGPISGTMADRLSLPSDGSYPRIYQNFTPTSTTAHVFSVWLKGETTGQGCFVGAFRNSPWSLPSSTNFNITTEWVKYSFNINPADTTSHQIYIGSHNSHGGKSFLISKAQLAPGTISSPFTNGSRSSTASLIDLKKSTNIDLSNVSFDSTGQPILDGTGDYFQTDTNCGVTGDITLEVVFEEFGGTAPHTTILCTDTNHNRGAKLMSYKNHDRYGLWLGFGSSGLLAMVSGALVNNTKYHLVGTWSQSTGIAYIYLNGVLTGTINTGETSQMSLANGLVTVGSDYHGLESSYGLNGSVPVSKIYNKVLTAEEVKQNFNAYKNRFNL